MYTLIRSIPSSRLVKEQMPAILIAILCAETFYKFHSFVLECLAFLATWFVLDLVSTTLGKLLHKRSRARGSST